MSKPESMESIDDLAQYMRDNLKEKKYTLLFAHNSMGKTYLSMTFKDLGKTEDKRDTLYFNAFTEDLFTWENDLENNSDRYLKINPQSLFFGSFIQVDMDTRIYTFLKDFVDFDFKIFEIEIQEEEDGKKNKQKIIRFFREEDYKGIEADDEEIHGIKISRGEENIFIWCVFLAILQLVIDEDETYKGVDYVFIDDPISSLDENNAIAVAYRLGNLLKKQNNSFQTIISSHHPLFFEVLSGILRNSQKYYLSRSKDSKLYNIREISERIFFYHIAMLVELYDAIESDNLYTYHFNILRNVLEKTARFHGLDKFSDCFRKDSESSSGDLETNLSAKIINILNHGDLQMYEPKPMMENNKELFKKIFYNFIEDYKFNIEYKQEA